MAKKKKAEKCGCRAEMVPGEIVVSDSDIERPGVILASAKFPNTPTYRVKIQKGSRGMSVQVTVGDNLMATGQALREQDNRATENPMFCVQVLERIGPMVPGFSDNLMFHDHYELETYYEDKPDREKWKKLKMLYDSGDLPVNVSVGGYKEVWKTVAVCFSEKGCLEHLELNGHNYRQFHGVRIYAECFYRNPEMVAVREFLAGLGAG